MTHRTRRALRMVALASLPLLAACGATAVTPSRNAAPQTAILYEQTLTVQMSDRTLCVGPRNRAPGRGWSGTLQGCPHLWPYTATLPPQRASRIPLIRDGVGAAQVTVTAPDGTVHRFAR